MRSDVVVIGAGVIGCSIAYHLAARGVRNVVVVDRAPDSAQGSTARATGGFRSQFSTEAEVRLSLLSRRKLLQFEDETGTDPGYRPYGYLFMARSRAELNALAAAQKVQHACGLDEARLVDEREIRDLNPAVDDLSLIGGTFCSTDGFIAPLQILAGYAAAARRCGVRFEYGRTLASIDPAVTTVNAAGAWAAEVSAVPVRPLRRRVAGTVLTDALPETMPMTIWISDGFHLRVREGRVLLLWPDTPTTDDNWMATVTRWAEERVPVLRGVPIDPQHCWEGFYEMSPDGHAIIGRDPRRENLFLATGSSGHGVMHAPAIGQVVSEMIVDGRSSIDVSALRPSRFEEGQPVRGPALL